MWCRHGGGPWPISTSISVMASQIIGESTVYSPAFYCQRAVIWVGDKLNRPYINNTNVQYVFTGYQHICIWSYQNLNDIWIKYPLLSRDSKILLVHLTTQKLGFLDYSTPSDKVHYCVVYCTTSATPLRKGSDICLINRQALRMATFNANQRVIRREILCRLIKLTQACISIVYVKHIRVS